jgi:hypothetical protein
VLFHQEAAYGGSPDAQFSGDRDLAEASTVELPYMYGVECRCYWPAQALAVLACVRKASPNLFPENLPSKSANTANIPAKA